MIQHFLSVNIPGINTGALEATCERQ